MIYNKEYSEKGMCNAFGRLRRIMKRLEGELQLNSEDMVLDIGCDAGSLVELLRPHCRNIIGIDINKDAIENSEVKGLKLMDARQTNFPDNYFTKIVSSHTIEHIPRLKQLFKEVERILKPGGIAIFNYPWELFRGMATMRNAWLFYGNPFKGYKIHINKLNHKKIANLIKDIDLKIVSKKFFFDPQPAYLTILKKSGR